MHDPRYLAGIVLFNRGDFFEAHEVWESLWMETHGPEKPFVQGLIQAAVGLCHFCNGNVRGAVKLYNSAKDYMARFAPVFWDLDVDVFWAAMHDCFAELLATPEPTRSITPVEERIPEIRLVREPDTWPDPDDYLEDDHAA
jgi:hypothetical protein